MKKRIILPLTLAITVLFWNYQELKIPGGLGFIRNNLGWLATITFISFYCFKNSKQKTLRLYSYWQLSLTGIISAVIPFIISPKTSIEVSWLLPFGLIGSWLLLIAFLQSKFFNLKPEIILYSIVAITAVEIIFGYGYILHRLSMDYTSGISFQAPNLKLNFNQRNLYASFLTTGLITSLYLVLKKQLTKQRKIQLTCLFFIGTFLLFFTESRTGIFSYIIGILLLGISYLKVNPKQIILLFLGAALTAIASYSSISILYKEGASKDFSNITHREFIYQTSIDATLDSPLLGHGLGSFTKIYTDKSGERINNENLHYKSIEGRPENLSHPHNELLYWSVQGGLISVVGLLLLILSLYLNFARCNMLQQLRYFALLAPIGSHLMVELPFYISTVHLISFVALLAFILIDSKSLNAIQLSSKTSTLGYVFAILMTTLTVPVINNIYSLTKAVRFQNALNQDIQDLNSIYYPLGWHNELKEMKLRYYANIAAKHGKQEPIVLFTQFLEHYNNQYPVLQNYFNLYYSYRFLKKTKKANIVLKEVKTKYRGVPRAERWIEQIENHSSRLKD